MKKPKFHPKLLKALAAEVGIPGNFGILRIAQSVASKRGHKIPQTKVNARNYLSRLSPLRSVMPNACASPQSFEASDAFLRSFQWRIVRMRILKRDGARCACCGATPSDGVRVHVDHIKPRRLFPQLGLVESNLQVLCEECNHGKGNWDQTDWRRSDHLDELDVSAASHLRVIK